MVVLTNLELNERLRYWQAKLRLQDWDIEAEFISPKHFSSEGECETWLSLGRARIRIKDTAIEQSGGVHDVEATLVHELLHVAMVRFEPEKSKQYEMDEYERFVEQMSQVLVRLNRDAENCSTVSS